MSSGVVVRQSRTSRTNEQAAHPSTRKTSPPSSSPVMSLICVQCSFRIGASPPLTGLPCRKLSFGGLYDRIRGKKKVPSRDEDILLQPPSLQSAVPAAPPSAKTSMWQDLTEEEVDKIRYKSGLPHEVLCEQKGIPVHGTRFTYLEHYRRDFVRQYFATYGRASGLKPGVCWPNKEELEFRQKWEETFYPKLQDMIARKKAEKEREEKQLAKYRADITAKLKKLPAMKKEFYTKLHDKQRQEQEEKAKREKVLQDVREYLGYDVAPGDTRFQEALAKKEEEELAQKKASKKQEKQAKVMAALAAMAEEQIKKAAEAVDKERAGESQTPAADTASGVKAKKPNPKK